jgi:Ca-activated chloride channel homolog
MNTPPSSDSSFGLVAWLEQTRVVLPLKGVEARFEVTGSVVRVELDQIFHQSNSQPLDCSYTFPLPAGAAVYRCELHINGRVIRAKVEATEQAEKIYREMKAAGRRAALVDSVRENLFSLALGNIQPGDLVVMRFAWFQRLDRVGDKLRLSIPTCPGVRYIPGRILQWEIPGRGPVAGTDQVPDAARLLPPRIDQLHPDAAYFSCEGSLPAADVMAGSVVSPSHSALVREAGERLGVSLLGLTHVPDRDLVFSWQETAARQLQPQSWRWTDGREAYVLAQLRAPAEVAIAESYNQDFYFLVDQSGSMQGVKWERTCEALQAFVGLLGQQDRVAVTLFESSYHDLVPVPQPAPVLAAEPGFRQLVRRGTLGGTELLPAARHVLDQISRHSSKRPATVVLITDGQVGNESTIIEEFHRRPTLTVHTFGIDVAVNDAFLKRLAQQQGGGCWLQTPNEDITGTIAALGDRLRRPVLTNLDFLGGWDVAPQRVPSLHAKEILTVSLCGPVNASLEIYGRNSEGGERRIPVSLMETRNEAIWLLWARERIGELLASGLKAEAIALAKRSNLICEGAAFIAWDEAEQVVIAREELVQPAMSIGVLQSEFRVIEYSRCCALVMDDSEDDKQQMALRLMSEDTTQRNKGITLDERVIEHTLNQSQPIQAYLANLQTVGSEADSLRAKAALRELISMQPGLGNCLPSGWLLEKLEQAAFESMRDPVDQISHLGQAIKQTISLRERCKDLGLSAERVDALTLWLWEVPDLVVQRMFRFDDFKAKLLLARRNGRDIDHQWQYLLNTLSPEDSAALAAALTRAESMRSGRAVVEKKF